MIGIAMGVAGKRKYIRQRAFTASLVADDRHHVGIQRKIAIKPCVGRVGVSGLPDMKAVYEFGSVAADLLHLGRYASDIDPVLWLVDDLAQAAESWIRFDPAVLVGRLRVLIFQLAQLIIDVVRVTALDAGFPGAKPSTIVFFGIS